MGASLIDTAVVNPPITASSNASTISSQAELGGAYFFGVETSMGSEGDYYNLASLSLGVGTWVLFGIYACAASDTITANLSTTSAASGSTWLTQTTGSGSDSDPGLIVAIAKLTTTTTIYLNGQASGSSTDGYGVIWALQASLASDY